MSPAGLRTVLILAGVVSFCGGCSRVHWRLGLDGALRQAAREHRLVLVYYWKPFNADCGLMNRTVFQSDRILPHMEGMILVKLDATFHKKRGERLGLREVPSFVVIAPNGRVLRRRSGVMGVDAFLAFLVVARLSG